MAGGASWTPEMMESKLPNLILSVMEDMANGSLKLNN
jgi:hypothetical protein